MQVKVRFRYNKATGEVEVFQVNDQGSNLSVAEHNREHERITRDLGSAVERYPRAIEMIPGSEVLPGSGIVLPLPEPDPGERHREPQTQTQGGASSSQRGTGP